MVHVLATTGVLALGAVCLVVFQRRFAGFERRYVWAGFGAHVVAAFGQVLITRYYYGGGDMLSYHRSGQRLAEWVRADFPAHAVELLRVFFQQADSFVAPGIVVHGVGGATGSMFAGAGFSALVTGGSLYAICVMWSLFAFVGQVSIYLGFRAVFRPLFYRRLLVAALLVPTVVFWSGGMLKEAAAIGGFGLVFLGIQRLIYGGRRLGYACLAVFGAVFVGLFKPYILFPFVLAAGIWFYWYRSMEDGGGVGLVVWILVGRGPSNVYRTVGRSPAAVFCVLFTVLFGAAVGLAAPNLGTLSRYRIPMMPFYVALLFVLAPVGASSS